MSDAVPKSLDSPMRSPTWKPVMLMPVTCNRLERSVPPLMEST